MDKNEAITRQAIAAGKVLLGREIVIPSNADFTPAGTRKSRLVRHKLSGRKAAPHIRWYVAGKAYRSLALTSENIQLSKDWEAAASSPA